LPDAITALVEVLGSNGELISNTVFVDVVIRRGLYPSARQAKKAWGDVKSDIKAPEGRHSEDTKRRVAAGDRRAKVWAGGVKLSTPNDSA
jgi:hypothetical protein